MKIKWLGHSCFMLTDKNGVRILTDPFDGSVGYQVPSVEADIVTTSHNHFDHNHVQALKGSFIHLDSPGRFTEMGIEITGISSFHDKNSGAKRGHNVIFLFNIDGLRVCHLGDLGHIPTDEQIKEIGAVDILLIPVGGTYTIDYKEAVHTVRQINPLITVPMHYKTPAINFPIDGVDKFLDAVNGDSRQFSNEIEINAQNIGSMPEIVLLSYE